MSNLLDGLMICERCHYELRKIDPYYSFRWNIICTVYLSGNLYTASDNISNPINEDLEKMKAIVSCDVGDNQLAYKPQGIKKIPYQGRLIESICLDRFNHEIKNPNFG